jgi:hypothetical protein
MLAAVALLALALAVVVLSIRLRSAHVREEALRAELQRIEAQALLAQDRAALEAYYRAIVEAPASDAERARAGSETSKPAAARGAPDSR